MTHEKCAIPRCKGKVDRLFLRAEERDIVRQILYCESDGEDFLSHYHEEPRVGFGEALSNEFGIAFDIELLMFAYDSDIPNMLFLREVGGKRLFEMEIGVFELSAIRWELEGLSPPRPPTHHAMDSIMASLGGCLERITIDNFTSATRAYEAKLHIRQKDRVVLVDVRPSDAVVLALIRGLPIFVLEDVLRSNCQ